MSFLVLGGAVRAAIQPFCYEVISTDIDSCYVRLYKVLCGLVVTVNGPIRSGCYRAAYH